jgi:RNA polymerase sigma factor (sigma-70 family)
VQNLSRDGLIDELYNANHAAVSRVCSRILRNPEDAADAAQQVFVIALESLDLSVKRGAARAWLLTVARNHCLDLLRRRKRLGKALVTLGSDADRGMDMESAVADRDFVGIVFKQLSRRERQALWHSAVESRPLADIAGRLRLSYMAAAQVVHRARRHAVAVAARVAVVAGVFQLGRQRPGGGVTLLARLAAVAAVPVIVTAVQSSSPIPRSTPFAQVPVSAAAAPTMGGDSRAALGVLGITGDTTGALDKTLPSVVANPDSVVPASTATLISAFDAVRQLLKPLPSALPVPTTVPGLP